MKKWRILIFLYPLLLFAPNIMIMLIAQESSSQTIKSSISNQHINGFCEDKYGYMWIATAKGLCKYNGYDYIHYYNNSSNAFSIPSDFITNIYLDSKQELWITTDKGGCKYDYETDKFINLTYPELENSPFEYGCFEDKDELFIFGFNGIKIIDKNNFTAKRNKGLPDLIVTTMIEDKNSNIWFGSKMSEAIYFYQKDVNQVEQLSIPSSTEIYCSYKCTNENIWFGTNKGLLIVDVDAKKIIQPEAINEHNQLLSKLRITQIQQMDQSTILIGTENKGAFFYNILSNKLYTAKENNFFPENKSVHITSFYKDSWQNIWMGTFDNGYYFELNSPKRFNKNRKLNAVTDGKFITRIAEDKIGNLWFGTRYDGLIYYDKKNQKETYYNSSNFEPLKKINNNLIQSLYIDSDDNLWIGFYNNIIYCHINNGNIISYTTFQTKSDIMTITEDSMGRIWVGSDSEGIFIYDLKKKQEMIQIPITNNVWNNVTYITKLKSGEMIFSVYNDGIYIVDPTTLIPRPLFTHKEHLQSLCKRVIFLFEDNNQNLWIGTYGNGAIFYNKNSDNYTYFGSYDGLPSNDILGIVDDKKKNIWLSTSYGLSMFDIKNKTFLNYFYEDGTGGNQFHEKSTMKSSNGLLYFGGNHGITYFDTEDTETQYHPIKVILEDLKILNISEVPDDTDKGVLKKHISQTSSIILNHKQNVFSIDYSAIHLNSNRKINYAYTLNGFDEGWNYVNDHRRATYSNLPAGEYTFNVMAQNPDGTWSNEPTSLLIEVKAAPWASKAAIIAYVLLAIILVYLSIYIYIRLKLSSARIALIEKERESEKEMTAMKIRFFSNISHELRTPLSMIYAPIKKMIENDTDKPTQQYLLQLVNFNIERLLRLIDQLLDFEKMESDTLIFSVSEVDIAEVIKKLILSFSFHSQEKNIDIKLNIPSDPLNVHIDGDAFLKILNNLLSNAIKYTPDNGHVIIDISIIDEAPSGFKLSEKAPQYLQVKVIDDGIGMRKEDVKLLFQRHKRFNENNKSISGKGIGLNYVKRLLEKQNGGIIAQPGEKNGMIFSFIVPINNIPNKAEELSDVIHSMYEHEILIPKKDVVVTKEQKTILIVEDNAELKSFLYVLLREEYNVLTASNGVEGYEKAKEEEIDLIVSDVLMPMMNGYELCYKIKNDAELCHIPFIILSAKGLPENLIEGYSQGADIYLNKPFNPEVLNTIIKNAFVNIERRRRSIGQIDINIDNKEEAIGDQETIELNPLDEKFLQSLYQYINKDLSNSELNVTVIGKELGFSRTGFYRKIKALTGHSPNDFLRIYRLNKAAELIIKEEYTISEICDMTGFGTHSYFSSSFKKHFGVSPKDYTSSQKQQ